MHGRARPVSATHTLAVVLQRHYRPVFMPGSFGEEMGHAALCERAAHKQGPHAGRPRSAGRLPTQAGPFC